MDVENNSRNMENSNHDHFDDSSTSFNKTIYKRTRFDAKKYVKYSKKKNRSSCLIKDCGAKFKGCIASNIKRHFQQIHNICIIHNKVKNAEEEEFDFNIDELEKYFDYDPLLNRSLCKAFNCQAVFTDINLTNLKNHYNQEHKEVENINLEDLEDYEVDKKVYHCLFKTCNVFPAQNLQDIKNHYVEQHSVNVRSFRMKNFETFCKTRYVKPSLDRGEEEFMSLEDSDTDEEEEDEEGDGEGEGGEPKRKKRKYTKRSDKTFKYHNYVKIYENENKAKCLIENCPKILSGIITNNIKRHFVSIHHMCIIHGINGPTAEKCENNLVRTYNESSYYVLDEFVFTNCNDKETKLFKCLFSNCSHFMPIDLKAIKTHYEQNHKICLIKHTPNRTISSTSDNENENENNLEIDQMANSSQTQCQNSQVYTIFNYSNYVERSTINNLSKCLIKTCGSIIKVTIVADVIKHYLGKHHFNIIENHENMPPYGPIQKVHKNISIEKFLDGSKCLFEKCDDVIPENWNDLGRHYYEKHKVTIMFKSSKRRKKSSYKKKKMNLSANESEDDEDSQDNDGISHSENDDDDNDDVKADNANCFVRNEFLSEDENHLNIKNDPLSPAGQELQVTLIKNEIAIDNEDDRQQSAISYETINTHENAIENVTQTLQQSLEISSDSNGKSLTKQRFHKLCLGLVIKYDLPLKLFNDEKYFKPLLAPYERKINSNIDSNKMENLMLKANHIIKDELKESFSNKVVSLELYVVRHEMQNYVIFNIRFLNDEMVQNKIIEFLPISQTTTTLPISQYLKKHNIDEQQVYMKTILATIQHDEIYTICNNLRQHNSDLKNHPIHELQLILRNFKEKYSEEIKSWQELTKYKEKLTLDIWNNLKDFAKHVKSLLETDVELKPKLQNAKNFFKTLQIFWNFFNKLSEEQYVVGDFYRDMLCCELELKEDITKNKNTYANNLNEELLKYKNNLLEWNEFIGALYLDIRFNFFGTRLLNEQQKNDAKTFLARVWDKYNNYFNTSVKNKDSSGNRDNHNVDVDDEYALLDKLLNDETSVSIQDKLIMWIPAKREPFSFNILNYWQTNNHNMIELNELRKIAFTFPASQNVMKVLKTNFTIFKNDGNTIDKFVMKFNRNILEQKENQII
ncbi:uncharacterized protein ACRADG_001736 [Cochliomyia hominivorax]